MSFWKTRRDHGAWLGVGVGTGVAIGVATHQLALWMCLGIVMAFVLDRTTRIARSRRKI